MKYIQLEKIGLIGIGVASILTACGGGGSSAPPVVAPAPDPNFPPVASASVSQTTVSENESVTLNASGSSDPDGDPLTYRWVQLTGTAAEIVSPTSAQTNVNLPDVDFDETVIFQVTISDGQLQANASVDVSVENLADMPGPNGVLTIRTKNSPVAMVGNIRLRGEDDSQLMFVEADDSGETSTVYYEIEGSSDGTITRGVPLDKTGGFQSFEEGVRFSKGYGRTNVSNFFAIESDRVLLMYDPDYNPNGGFTEADQDKIYEPLVELVGDNACLVTTQFFLSPFGPVADRGYVFVGYREGGLKLFSWSYDEPEDVSETVLDQTKSYCGSLKGSYITILNLGTPLPPRGQSYVTFLDVAGRTIDLYKIVEPLYDRDDPSAGAPPEITVEGSTDLSNLGVDPNARYVESFGDTHLYTTEAAGNFHQILFTNELDRSGNNVLRVDIQGSLPTDAHVVPNEVGSPFHDPSVAVSSFLVLMQPDMNRVVKVPLEETVPSCTGCTAYVALAPSYQTFSSNAATITAYETRLGDSKRLVFTHPDENRITVYPWAAP